MRIVTTKIQPSLPRESALINVASLDVPAATLKAVTRWIALARRASGCRPAQRVATVHAQVLLVLRWMRQRADLRALAHDSRVSIATAYR